MLPEVESLRVRVCGFLKMLYPQGRSQTLVYQLWMARHAFILAFYARIINPKHSSMLSTHRWFYTYKYIGRVTSCKRKIASRVTVKGEGGVAGEGRVVGVPKFHSRDKCTMPLTNINSDWMSNAPSGLCINLRYLYYLRGSFILHLGV